MLAAILVKSLQKKISKELAMAEAKGRPQLEHKLALRNTQLLHMEVNLVIMGNNH